MNFIVRTRIALINTGKVLPFVLCIIVLISYTESFTALLTENYLVYGDYYVLNKPISWFIGSYFEYNAQMLVVLTIISIAIQTCVWNKISCLYLALNLIQKSWFAEHEYDITTYYIVIIANMIICAYLIYKGLKQLTR